MDNLRMTSLHYNIVSSAICKWMETENLKTKCQSIIMAASCFNWEVFMAAKVHGNSVLFMTKELMPYLHDRDITRALMHMTKVNGTGYHGSGVSRNEICYR